MREEEPSYDNAREATAREEESDYDQARGHQVSERNDEVPYNKAHDGEAPSRDETLYHEARAENISTHDAELPFGHGETVQEPGAYVHNGSVTKRGGAEPRPPLFSRILGIGAILAWFGKSSAHRARARRDAEDRMGQKDQEKSRQPARDYVTEIGGAGLLWSFKSQGVGERPRTKIQDNKELHQGPETWMVCPGTRKVLHGRPTGQRPSPGQGVCGEADGERRTHREQVARRRLATRHCISQRGGARSWSVRKWLARDGGLRTRLRDSRRALGTHFGRIQRWVVRSQQAQDGDHTGHQPNNQDGSTEPGGPSPQQSNTALVVPPAPTPRSASSGSPASFPSYTDLLAPEGYEYQYYGGPSQPAPFSYNSELPAPTSTSSVYTDSGRDARNVSSRNSRGIRLSMRDFWELRPTDFRSTDVDLSRPRSFDIGWLTSLRGRIWLNSQQEEQIDGANRVDTATEGPSSSSYESAGYHAPATTRPAFHSVGPVGDVQGTRTLSLDSWFDHVANRRMGPWFTPRFPDSAESNVYNATPLRLRSPERENASRNQVLRPSDNRSLNRPRAYTLSVPAHELPRRPSSGDNIDHQSASTATSSRFPSAGSPMTPPTTAGDGSRVENAPSSKDAPQTDGVHQTDLPSS